MSGYPREQFMGRSPVDFVLPQYRELVIQQMRSGSEESYEVVCHRADGSPYNVEVRGRAINFRGKLARVAAVRDITQRKRVENRLAKCWRSWKSRTVSSSTLLPRSHDLQETAASGDQLHDVLAERFQGHDADSDEFFQFALDGAKRMKSLIRDVLAYCRFGVHSIHAVPTDCSLLVDQITENLQLAIEQSNAEIKYEALPTVLAISAQLGLVLQNLIGNGSSSQRRASPPYHQRPIAEDDWVFSVRDNGIGIAPQNFDKVFVLFNGCIATKDTPAPAWAHHLQEDYRVARRTHLARVGVGQGLDIFIHHPGARGLGQLEGMRVLLVDDALDFRILVRNTSRRSGAHRAPGVRRGRGCQHGDFESLRSGF